MDAQTAPRPTGRRKITPPQLRAEASGAVPFSPTTPGRVLAAFKRAAPALGMSRRVVDFVDCLFARSYPQDWDGSPGLGPIVWLSDAELEDRLCVARSQRKAIVRAVLDAGYVRLRRSPTGKRYGHRDKAPQNGGRITDAYGFDLSPLAERAAEFERLAAEWEARKAEGRRLRREITSSRNHVLSLVDLAVVQGLEGEDWPAAAAKAEALWRARGEQRDPLALVPIAARLRALDIHVQEQVEAVLAVVESKETDPAGPEYRPRFLPTNQPLIAKANTRQQERDKVGPTRPEAHENQGSRDHPSQRVAQRQARVESSRNAVAIGGTAVGETSTRGNTVPLCALGVFAVTPGFILEVAPVFRDWTSSARPGWDELARAAGDIRSALGISPHLWAQAWTALGDDGAITALAVTCAVHAAGGIKTTPGAYLSGMLRRHGAGELRLDRTLYGLAAKAGAERRWESAVEAGRERQHDRQA